MISQYDNTVESGQLVRVASFNAPTITLFLDGVPIPAPLGGTVLTAILTQGWRVRRHDVDGCWRAGFCLMGACQDCWVWFIDGGGGRACTTLAADGMRVLSQPPDPPRA